MTEARTTSSNGHDPEKTAHILVTQCLQNGFFLADDCRLCLPREQAVQMLVGNQTDSDVVGLTPEKRNHFIQQLSDHYFSSDRNGNRREIRSRHLSQGPLYRFLSGAITKKPRNSDLHVINIRDWHVLSEQYDHERRVYGKHCEANTWEAEPLEGFEEFLAPWKADPKGWKNASPLLGYQKQCYPRVHFHEVLSDSVFDFRHSDAIEEASTNRGPRSHFETLFQELTRGKDQVYVVVIGVYTDIKIKTLLMGLQSRFPVRNLIVPDVLTAAPSLERHLEGLDFADKVLNVEVIHSLNGALSVLDHEEKQGNGGFEEIPQQLFLCSIDYTKMRTHFLDRQNVLGYQDQKIAEYLLLTSRRSADVYRHVYSTNRWLTWFGRISLSLLVLMIVAEALDLLTINWKAWLAAGLGSTAQILPAFFTKPLERMQQNLNNLVRLRNYLESYSLTTAILRHHLTSAELLCDHDLAKLKRQMELIQEIAARMRINFLDIARRTDATSCKETIAEIGAALGDADAGQEATRVARNPAEPVLSPSE